MLERFLFNFTFPFKGFLYTDFDNRGKQTVQVVSASGKQQHQGSYVLGFYHRDKLNNQVSFLRGEESKYTQPPPRS